MSWDTVITPQTATEFNGYWEPSLCAQPFTVAVDGKPRIIFEFNRTGYPGYKRKMATLWEYREFTEGISVKYLTRLYGGFTAHNLNYFDPGNGAILIVKPLPWIFYDDLKIKELL